MENIKQEIKLSKFDGKQTIKDLVNKGYHFKWGHSKPKGYITYYEVDKGQRMCYTNSELTAYMSANNEQKQKKDPNHSYDGGQQKMAERIQAVRTRTGEMSHPRSADKGTVGDSGL